MADDDATLLVTVASGGTTDAAAAGGAVRPPLGRGDVLGRYVVLHRAGVGGMGEVYAAYDPELDRKVAIKLLSARGSASDPHASSRLLHEAQALAKLSHPGVVAVYDVGTHDDRVFIAMEFIDGVTLQRWLAERKRPWRVVLATLLQAGRALAVAHDAGIIHRDFKPGNVMIDATGAVRVLDFGLARRLSFQEEAPLLAPSFQAIRCRSLSGELDGPASGTDELDAIEASGSSLRVSRRVALDLTRTGIVTGTPAYMAPEQFLAGELDARTDQFAFCVTLFEALWYVRPFEAADASSQRDAVVAGRVRAIPDDSEVPQRVRRQVLRGLAVDPATRHPSMPALVEALERAALPRWRRVVLPLGIFAVVAMLVAAVRFGDGASAPPCAGVEDKLAQAWDPARREQLATAFTATGKPYAADVLRRVERGIDEYAAAWGASRRDACEATRVRGEQSEELLDRRMACLDDRLRELAALTGRLAAADAQLVERAPDALGRLGDLRRCEPSVVLDQRLAPPSPDQAEAVAAVRSELTGTEVLAVAGKYAEALVAAEAIVARAHALGYAPLVGEALHQLGGVKAALGQLALGEAAHTEALLVAERVGHDLLELKCRISLAATVGVLLARPEQGRVHVRFAAAVADRIGPSHGLVGTVALTEALMEFRAGDNLAAEAKMLVALAEREAGRGVDHPEVGAVLVNLGAAQVGLGKLDQARASFERAGGIFEASYGARHPLTASTMNNLGLVFFKQRRYEDARQMHERALAIWNETLPPNHPELGKAHHNLGSDLSLLGRYDEALAEYAIALAKKQASVGDTHPSMAATECNIGDALNKLGRPQEAVAHLEHARAIIEAALGADHIEMATVYTTMGNVQLALGHMHEAAVVLARSEAIMMRQPGSPADLAETRFALARALWADAADHARARALARQAHEAYVPLGEAYASETAATATWLAEHRSLRAP